MFNWKVLFVKPNTEKKMAEYCEFYRIPCYLPLQEKTREIARYNKKGEMIKSNLVKSKVPLFTGYMFARFNMSERLPLLKTNLLVRILEPLKPRDLVRDILMVRRALRMDPSMGAIKPLTHGDKVQVIDGPFMGWCGYVLRVDDLVKVVLNVEMIGKAVAVHVELHQIKPVKDDNEKQELQGGWKFHPAN